VTSTQSGVTVAVITITITIIIIIITVSNSQVIGCEDRLRNDLCCVGWDWGVKLCSIQSNQSVIIIIMISNEP